MNNIGDIKTFSVVGAPPVGVHPIYVYRFWDGTVAVTQAASGAVTKMLNLGGNPAENGSPPYTPPFTVPFRCDICDSLGNVVQVLTDKLAVNNPPTLASPPQVKLNDQAYPYTTDITLQAYDMENNGVKFLWYLGVEPIGGKDVTTGPVAHAGTYYGTLIGADRDRYTNIFTTTIYGAGTNLTCKIVDGDLGTHLSQHEMRGYDSNKPQFSTAVVRGTILASTATPPLQTIAPSQSVVFTGYAYDPLPGNLHFCWYFYGSYGWSQPGLPIIQADAGTPVERGKRSNYTLAIANETTPGLKTAIMSATNDSTSQTVFSSIPVRLQLNNGPAISGVGLYDATTGQPISRIVRQTLPLRTLVKFSGTALDIQSDAVTYRWDIYAPPADQAYTLYGRDALVDVSYWAPSTYAAIGVVTATDRFGVSSLPHTLVLLTVA